MELCGAFARAEGGPPTPLDEPLPKALRAETKFRALETAARAAFADDGSQTSRVSDGALRAVADALEPRLVPRNTRLDARNAFTLVHEGEVEVVLEGDSAGETDSPGDGRLSRAQTSRRGSRRLRVRSVRDGRRARRRARQRVPRAAARRLACAGAAGLLTRVLNEFRTRAGREDAIDQPSSDENVRTGSSVSYTHLTLPTILLV